MANKFQLKRTTVSGRTANTTDAANSAFLDKGELAINLVDRKVFSSDTANTLFEIGSNLTSLAVTTVVANGGVGTAGQVLSSNGTGVYWGSAASGGVTSIIAANGLNGGTITTSGTLSVLGGSTLTVNSLGTHVNSALSITSLSLTGVASLSVGTSFVANTSRVIIGASTGLQANGQLGTAGQVLVSNGSAVYWGTSAGGSTGSTPSMNTYTYTIAANTVLITGADDTSNTLVYTSGLESVFINGSRQISGVDYNTTSNTVITLTSNAINGDIVQVTTLNSSAGGGGNATISDPIVINDISGQFDGAKAVFNLLTDQTPVTGIVDSKDIDVTVNGLRLIPYIDTVTFPWLPVFDQQGDYRVRNNEIIIYNSPTVGDRSSIILRQLSATRQKRKYPYSANTISLGV